MISVSRESSRSRCGKVPMPRRSRGGRRRSLGLRRCAHLGVRSIHAPCALQSSDRPCRQLRVGGRLPIPDADCGLVAFLGDDRGIAAELAARPSGDPVLRAAFGFEQVVHVAVGAEVGRAEDGRLSAASACRGVCHAPSKPCTQRCVNKVSVIPTPSKEETRP